MNTDQNYGAKDASATNVISTASKSLGRQPFVAVGSKDPDCITSLSLDVPIRGSRFEYSGSMILMWALDAYRKEKFTHLLQIVNDPEGLKHEAGALYAEISTCDQFLMDLIIGLNQVALRNSELVQLQSDPERAATEEQVDSWHREALADMIDQAVAG